MCYCWIAVQSAWCVSVKKVHCIMCDGTSLRASRSVNAQTDGVQRPGNSGCLSVLLCERTSIRSPRRNNNQTRWWHGVHPFSVLSGKQKKQNKTLPASGGMRFTADASVTSAEASQSGSDFTVAKWESGGGGRITGRGYLTDAPTGNGTVQVDRYSRTSKP